MIMKGILLDSSNDLKVVNGTLDFGSSVIQEVGLILSMNKGELKSDPRLGPGLLTFIRSGANLTAIQQRVRQHLAMDGKDFDSLKDVIAFNLTT